MELSPRSKQILHVLLGESEPIPVKLLAEQIGVSKRTVQRELEYLILDMKGSPVSFKSRTGVGVWLEGSAEEKEALHLSLQEEEIFDVSNKQERRKRLILEILKEKGLKKLFYYSSLFAVSEATISNDLEAVEGWFNQNHLFIQRKPGSGIFIEGNEEDYRKAIRVFIAENLEEQKKDTGFEQILNRDVLKRVENTIAKLNEERVLNLTENAYAGLILHISIAINRILKEESIEENAALLQQAERDLDYELAGRIVQALEEEFQISISKMEIYYICLHIKGAKHQKIEIVSDVTVELERKELQKLVNEMIDAYHPETVFLLKQDDEFLQGLLAHLQPTMIRLMYDMKITNPVLKEIKEEYPDIFENCRRVGKVLEEWTGKMVPESEIGFLTVHFGAAIVRMEDRKENLRRVEVGIVCASGIGISRLMATRIERVFKDRVHLTTYGNSDITPYTVSVTDFFVSSMPLDMDEEKLVYVNPLLTEHDIEHIRKKVYEWERMPLSRQHQTKFELQLEQVNFVAGQIKGIISSMEFLDTEPDIGFEELVNKIGERFSFYEEQREQIKQDIMRRERLGSQIFAEFDFALLHTRTMGTEKPRFGICMTRDRNAFQSHYFQGIHVVFIMLIPDDEHVTENSDILGYISSSLIEDLLLLDVILKGDKEQARGALADSLRKYFRQFLEKKE